MDRQRPSLQWMVLVTLLSCGCTSSPWSARTAASQSPALPSPQTASPQSTAGAMPDGAAAPGDTAGDQAAIDAMMVEIERTQALDPASRERLAQDLRQTEPKLRPMVLQQFRAALAYRRQAEQREAAAPATEQAPGQTVVMSPVSGDLPARPWNQAPAATPRQGPEECRAFGVQRAGVAMVQPYANEPKRVTPAPRERSNDSAPVSTVSLASAPLPSPAPPPAPRPAPASESPLAQDPRVGPDRAAPNERPAAADQPERVEFSDAKPLASRTASEPSGCVPTAALLPASPASDDWRANLAAAIRAMEASVPRTPQSAEDIAQHARLRMLYLVADRRDDALRPIPAAPTTLPDMQEFWSNELYGLAVWLDSQRITDSRRRADEAKRHLEKAVSRLAEMSPLVVRNLTFVTEVQSFGSYKPCRKAEFAPEEAVLLYAEVGNLKSEETPKGCHTAWRSSYRIFDHRGQMVVDREPTASEEYCQNLRHDFFIGCQFTLPKRIYPGKHTLHLTVEDVKGQKTGESSIEFTVKPPAESDR